ncbi:MAG TPA: DUF4974 domain-containing protein [Candidatus Rifleibacterium sp.]|nr:DUF4974 domain-containing protein [Candidatus Rifleibacterium sp.]HPT46810.1 DUF4974 domain-containing protein [Candidatus Rifleibacterium sp.]
MKRIVIALFSLTLLLVFQQTVSANSDLDNAIIRLYSNGPDSQTEETLKQLSESSDQSIAGRARFHLLCLQIIKGGEDAGEKLAKLELNARNDAEKETVKLLKELQQQKSNKIPEQFQDKISLDFTNARVQDIVSIIARRAKANIVVHNTITDKITLSLKDATLMQAIETICAMTDLRYENNDGIFIILPRTSRRRDNYEKREIRLAFLSPQEALKMAATELGEDRDNKAPAHLSAEQAASRPTAAENRNVTFKATEDSIIMEGELTALDKFENFLRNLDKKGKAQKVSFRIWKTNAGKAVTMQDFAAMDDAAKKQAATIISAPVLITLPGKEAKIEVGERNPENDKTNARPMSYSMSCIIHETANPDVLRLIARMKVSGSALENGRTVEIKKDYAPTLDIARNKWVLLPIYEGAESMFLELQVGNHVE